MDYAGLALLWGGCCAVHSALAAEGIADVLARLLGVVYRRFYRLFYNGLSVLSLLFVLRYTHSVSGETFWVWTGGWLGLQVVLVIVAVVVFLLGLRRYEMGQFTGLAQLFGGSGRGLAAGGGVDTGGILSAVRHPWYLAILLLLWARDLLVADLVVNAVLMLYLVGGTILEERKLVAAFGDEYRAYQQRVSMLVPWKWLRAWIGR
jgi:protein-S-isoprenylcysteine O-methyltransferase Ste14